MKTICGTNEYMAPEMILRKGYGKAVDWWSMGALMYEMTAGYPPFQGKTPKDLNRKILNERVSLPKWLSPTAHQVSHLNFSLRCKYFFCVPGFEVRNYADARGSSVTMCKPSNLAFVDLFQTTAD